MDFQEFSILGGGVLGIPPPLAIPGQKVGNECVSGEPVVSRWPTSSPLPQRFLAFTTIEMHRNSKDQMFYSILKSIRSE